MSYTIMPALPISMAKGLKKTPVFDTVLQKVAAMRGNGSTSLTPYASWAFEFDLDRITGNEAAATSVIAQFLGVFMACQGSNQPFLFTDPQDNAVSLINSGMIGFTTAGPIVAGDGATTQFQLARSIGGVAWDLIQNLNGSIVVKVNGSPVTPASVSSTGLVTFTTAPTAAATLEWEGSFYFLCRFSEDTVDAVRAFTMNSGTDQWDVDSLKFSSEFV